MKFIRKILVKLLGLKGYLRLVSTIYIRCISMGLMRSKYPELYFIRRALKPGETVLDIGANLGYYSFFMSRAVGPTGQVHGVEPIPLFAEVWKKNMSRLKHLNYKLNQCALGTEEKQAVTMSIPIVNGVVRHGLTKVVEGNQDTHQSAMSFEVPMVNGDKLISEAGITRLAMIKCDVEGFEQYVIPSLDQTIKRNLPLLQIELSGDENRQKVCTYLVNLTYRIFILKQQHLVSIEINDIFTVNQDFYFIHESRLNDYKNLVNS